MPIKEEEIQEIHNSLVNGQRKQMVRQINKYGTYEFWEDYRDYLANICPDDSQRFSFFADATISYFHLKDFMHKEYD